MSTEVYLASRNDRLALIDLVSRGASGAAGTGSSPIYPQHHIPVTVQLHTSAAQGDILGITNHFDLSPTADYQDDQIPKPARRLQRYYDDAVFSSTTIVVNDHLQKRVILLEGGNAGDIVQAAVLGLVSTRLELPEDAEEEEVFRAASLIDGEQKYLKADPLGDITVWHHELGEPEQIVPCWVLLGAGGISDQQVAIGKITTEEDTLQELPGPCVVKWQAASASEDAIAAVDDEEERALEDTGIVYSGTDLYAINPRSNYLRRNTFYSFIRAGQYWFVDNQLSFIEYQ